jgi:Domain of unknown function (DUF4266)
MRPMNRLVRCGLLGLVTLATLATGGCATVRPWEREGLSSQPMQADGSPCARFDRNVDVYREGAAGANGGKSGGGCGCT